VSATNRLGTSRVAPSLLVIFDCDGVLVDSERISNGVLAEMLSAQGWELSLAESRARFQGLMLEQVRGVAEEHLGRALPGDWLDEFVRRRAAVFDAELEPVEGAERLVRRVLSAGIAVCVASQGSLAKTARSLALTGLDELFGPSARFSAQQVARGKPEPDLFLYAAAAFGVAPQYCAVVEDTPSGVTAGVRAGMTVYGFSADSDERALRDAGAITSPSLDQLGALLVPSQVDS
jgi:HAD superfamily hydrolase (TIGR01509 family)